MPQAVRFDQHLESSHLVNGKQKSDDTNRNQVKPQLISESVTTSVTSPNETILDVPEESATRAFAEFVANTDQNAISPNISTKLKTLLLDYLGVASAAGHAAESSPAILKGIKAFAGSFQGHSTVLTKGSTFAPQYAALLNGAWSHSHDFDDTCAQAILHPGCSVISAALAEAETLQASGADLLLALTVGYEVACRIGISLGTGSYKRGFHNTGTSGIFGAVAAICKLRNLPPSIIESSLGLALSKAGGSMQFLDNGSWNKRLHPGFAAHDALLCVSLAQAGVIGASHPLEGKYGATALFSSSGNPSLLSPSTLGSTWTFLSTACKPFPACRMTHGVLEMVGKLHKSHHLTNHPSSSPPTLKSLLIHLPPANYPVVGLPTPNKTHPVTTLDAQFSIYFQASAAYLHGANLGMALYDQISDPAVHALADKIRVEIDEGYVNLESRIEAVFEDGSVVKDEVVFPLAEPGRPFEWDTGVLEKFLGLAGPVYGVGKGEEIWRMVERVEEVGVGELMGLLA